MEAAFDIRWTDALFHGIDTGTLRGSFEAAECAILRRLHVTKSSRHQMVERIHGAP